MDCAFRALLGPGDHVVCMKPAYQSLYEIALNIGCTVDYWEVTTNDDGRPSFEVIISKLLHLKCTRVAPVASTQSLEMCAGQGSASTAQALHQGSVCKLSPQSYRCHVVTRGLARADRHLVGMQCISLFRRNVQVAAHTIVQLYARPVIGFLPWSCSK